MSGVSYVSYGKCPRDSHLPNENKVAYSSSAVAGVFLHNTSTKTLTRVGTKCAFLYAHVHVQAMRSLAMAKLYAFDTGTHGQFFWNFRTELEPRWDYMQVEYHMSAVEGILVLRLISFSSLCSVSCHVCRRWPATGCLGEVVGSPNPSPRRCAPN